jgi:hypothetical protein
MIEQVHTTLSTLEFWKAKQEGAAEEKIVLSPNPNYWIH